MQLALLKDLNKALTYIEENLENEIDMVEVANIARSSEYHFKKMFSYLSGITLLEYIRRRRLTLAGIELGNHNTKVIDVAMKYGYHSPDSFAKAFYQLHGINPSKVKSGKSLKAFPRMTFQLTIKGGNALSYRIEKKEAFRIVGIKKRVPLIFHGVNPVISSMWNSLDDEMINKLKDLSTVKPSGVIDVSTNVSEGWMEEKAELDHYVGVATTKNGPEDLSKLEVPASTWAVFEAEGRFPDALQDVWGRIYSEWFPSSNYEQAEGPSILWNVDEDINSPIFKSEIWIPIQENETN